MGKHSRGAPRIDAERTSAKPPTTKTIATNLALLEARKVAAAMTDRYNLCLYCLGRLFARQMRLSVYEPLGRNLWRYHAGSEATPKHKCYICRGLYAEVPQILQMMRDATDGYEFDTFSVGAIIKPSVMDRDDRIRSSYRLQGSDSVKAGLTRELGRRFARMTASRQDRHEPEMTITVQPAESYCEVRPKPVAVFGRYLKRVRGVPQKQDSCTSCLGRGCFACDMHGLSSYESVEGQISEFLFGAMGGTTARFTWIGGEDRDSLVSGSGRPFFARLQKPKKRQIKYDNIKNLKSVSISSLRDVAIHDVRPLRFSSRAKILVAFDAGDRLDSSRHAWGKRGDAGDDVPAGNSGGCNDDCASDTRPGLDHCCKAAADLDACTNIRDGQKPDSTGSGASHSDTRRTVQSNTGSFDMPHAMNMSDPGFLRRLRRLSGSLIRIRSKNDGQITKKIHRLTYRRSNTGAFVVWADLEGGIPVKRLVTGDGVTPSISEILGVPCRCARFDFEDVWVQDGP